MIKQHEKTIDATSNQAGEGSQYFKKEIKGDKRGLSRQEIAIAAAAMDLNATYLKEHMDGIFWLGEGKRI